MTVKAPPLFVSVTVPCGRVVDTPMISPSAYPFAAIYHITVKLLHVQDMRYIMRKMTTWMWRNWG